MTAPSRPAALSPGQTGFFIAYGALLWFAAALLVRFLEPTSALQGGMRVLTYLLVIPGTVPFVLIGRKLTKLVAGQVVPAMTIATATALLLDGMAVAWIPWLYGTTESHVLAGAAVILWGGGVGLVLGFVYDRR
jgi:hypothetical protein